MSVVSNATFQGPVQLLRRDSGGKLALNTDQLEAMLMDEKVKGRQLVVVSVVGAFRRGKSFLLNFILRYLRCQRCDDWIKDGGATSLEGFSWRGGLERDTKGILVWPEVFLVEKDKAVILMDTQGYTFDSRTSLKDNAIIFALSTLVSSVQIFNSFERIQMDDISNLQLFCEFGNMVQKKCNFKPFQKLIFLIRDWKFPQFAPFGFKGGEIVLKKWLTDPDVNKEHANMVTTCFSDISCYLMPHPGKKVTDDKNFKGCIEEIDENFLNHLNDFIETVIRDSLVPKKVGDKDMSPTDLVLYLQKWTVTLQEDNIEPKTLYKELLKMSLQADRAEVSHDDDVDDDGFVIVNFADLEDGGGDDVTLERPVAEVVPNDQAEVSQHQDGVNFVDLQNGGGDDVILEGPVAEVMHDDHMEVSQHQDGIDFADLQNGGGDDVILEGLAAEVGPYNQVEASQNGVVVDFAGPQDGADGGDVILQGPVVEVMPHDQEESSQNGVVVNLYDLQNGAGGDGISESPEEELSPYVDEFERLKSFPIAWNDYYNKGDLARHGFYFYYEDAVVICVFCSVHLDAGIFGEPLKDLHKRLGRNCNFAYGRPTVNIALGDAENYRLEKHRLVSFLRTNWTAPVDPYDLAKWGFYWTGTADVSRCVFCRLEVRGWEQGDRGESEHLRWNPQCAFLQRRAVGNIPLGDEGNNNNIQVDRAVNQEVTERIHIIANGPRPTNNELGINVITPPKHPQYFTLSARLSSFSAWPLSITQRPQQLADAGFYYTGRGDRVICYQCGGGLKDWGPTDDPWVEHAVWFTTCAYLIAKKGMQFIISIQAVKNGLPLNPQINASTSTLSVQHAGAAITAPIETMDMEVTLQEPPAHPQPEMNSSAALQQNAGEGSSNDNIGSKLCMECRQRDLGIVFLPCGHMATCAECATRMKVCPICRKMPNAYVRAFLA